MMQKKMQLLKISTEHTEHNHISKAEFKIKILGKLRKKIETIEDMYKEKEKV